jgi:clan AA aspartic protease (TIGR02281 family)
MTLFWGSPVLTVKKHSSFTLIVVASLAFCAGLLWTHWQAALVSSAEVMGLGKNDASELQLQEKLTSPLLPLKKVNQSNRLDMDDATKISKNALAQFKQQLSDHNYPAAVNTYQISLNTGDARKLGLKPILMAHLWMLISSSSEDHFTELTEHYLSVFYDDVDVLLSLAEFNRSIGFLAEAAAVHHLVKSYAYTNRDTLKVEAAIDDFIRQIHANLVAAGDLFGLTNIYEQMRSLNLPRPIHRLGQAQIYLQTGNLITARDILVELTNEPSVSIAAEKIMLEHQQQFASSNSNKIALQNDYSDQIALVSRGNQYWADLEIEDNVVTLLIDTGASMTTLSRQAFQALPNTNNFDLMGQRMFNTANGITKGNIYRVDRLALGRFTLNNAQIAVLDFKMPEGVDGLLGMNVLQHFRFHID